MFRLDKVGKKREEVDQDEIDNLEDIVFNRHSIKKLKSQNYSKLKEEQDDNEQTYFQIDKQGDKDNLEIEEKTVETKTESVWKDDDDEIG